MNESRRNLARQILVRTGGLAGLWWVLTEGRTEAWLPGLFAVWAALAASFALPGPSARQQWRPAGLLLFLPFFFKNSLTAGIDVARRAFTPALPLAPGLVEYEWRLPAGPARVFLANAISLLPGTLSVGFDERKLTIHALDCNHSIRDEVARFEAMAARIFSGIPRQGN